MSTYPLVQRVYWINVDSHSRNRTAMYSLLAKSRIPHIRVPGLDAHKDFAGNIMQAQTLSHVLLYERVHSDCKHGQVVLVLEDTVSSEYVQYWTNTLDTIVQCAPSDWGIIQLSYRCDEPTILRVNKTMSQSEYISRSPDYVEKRVFLDNTAPYVEWKKWRPSLACAYLLHPRGYNMLLKYANSNHFNYNCPVWDALFPYTRTYTYHRPLFTTCKNDEHPSNIIRLKRKEYLTVLVKSWYTRWLQWKNRKSRHNAWYRKQ